MRFHLVDRIDHWKPWVSLSARKVTSRTESLWRAGPHGPEMSLGLAAESLCQAGNWLLMLSSGHKRRGALLKAGMLTASGSVRPGDELRLEVEMSSVHDDSAVLEGRISVGEQCVLEADDIICSILDAERLGDPEATAHLADRLIGTEGLR